MISFFLTFFFISTLILSVKLKALRVKNILINAENLFLIQENEKFKDENESVHEAAHLLDVELQQFKSEVTFLKKRIKQLEKE